MRDLKFLCHNDSLVRAKIALLTFHNSRLPVWAGKLLVFFEYLQLASQGLLIYSNMFTYQSQTNQIIFQAVIYLLKLINPAYLLPFGLPVSDSLTSSILLIIFIYSMLKYILFGYIVCIAYFDLRGSDSLITLWKWTFWIQGRIMCYFVTSFWVRAILSYGDGNYTFYGMSKPLAIGLCCFLIGVEYIFSFLLEIQFSYVLPSKSFLSSKTYAIRIMNLSQKLAVQILSLILQSASSLAGSWAFGIVNLAISAIRAYQFYRILPIYSLKALLYEGSLIAMITSLNFASLVQTVVAGLNYDDTKLNLVVILWIVTGLSASRIFRRLLEKKLMNIYLGDETKNSAGMLVQKVIASRQLIKTLKLPGNETKKYSITYLLNTLQDLNPKKDHKICFNYIEKISCQYPQDRFVKLYLAYLGSKDAELSLKAIGILTELRQKKWSQYYLSVLLLAHRVQKTMMKQHNNDNIQDNSGLDIKTYTTSQTFVELLKADMLQQTESKMTICNNILAEVSNIGKIHSCAQLADKARLQIQKKIDILAKEVPESFIEPYLLIAGYYIALEYSPKKFRKYADVYTNKQIKLSKCFQDLTLNNENLYQDTNAFLIVSAEKLNSGQIIFCSHSLQGICGGEKKSYETTHFSSLFTPSFQVFYTALFKQFLESGHMEMLNKVQTAYMSNKAGYIVEVELYMNVHPYRTQHLYLDMVIRPVPSSKEYLIIKENGDIEGATKKITKAVGITGSMNAPGLRTHNIRQLSEELFTVNEGFNKKIKEQLIQRFETERFDNLKFLDYKKSGETESPYLQANTIELNQNLWSYKISSIPCGSTSINLITLEEAIDYENNLVPADNSHELSPKLKVQNQYFSDNEDVEFDYIDVPENKHEGNLRMNSNNFNNYVTTDANFLLTVTHNNSTPTEPPLSATLREKQALLTQRFSSPGGIRQKQILFSESDHAAPKAKLQRAPNSSQSVVNLQDKMFKTFQANIRTKSYPKSFKPLCLAFYAVISLTLMSQIILKVVSDSTLADLVIKKNALNYSQLRSYKAIQLVANYEVVIGAFRDPLNLVNKGSTQPLSFTIPYASTVQPEFQSFNEKLFETIGLLDVKVSDQLLAKDVTMYGMFTDSESPTNITVTSFDAADRIISAIFDITYQSNYNSSEAYELANFIIKNIMNDFLYKSAQITSIFQDSVRTQRDYFQSTIQLFLVITPLLLVCIALVLISIIWNQYSIEKKQLLAFIKLDPQRVKEMLARFKHFRRELLGEEKHSIENYWRIAMQPQNFQERNYHKSQLEKNINYQDIRKKYYSYILKIIFYILILIGVTTGNYTSAQDSTKVIYTRQSQLEFASQISETLSVTYASTIELLLSNNTRWIKHMLPSVAALLGLNKTIQLEEQIADSLKEEDGTYDPQIKILAFDAKPCSYYNWTKSISVWYCNSLQGAGYPTNLVSLINSVENMAKAKMWDYNTCNKSTTVSLLNCTYRNVNPFAFAFALASTEAQLIGNIIGTNLENSVSNAYKDRNVFLAVFVVSLIVAGVLTWYQILSPLKEVHNEFRKVLQIFPPSVILSSFLLKVFLQQNAKSFFRISN